MSYLTEGKGYIIAAYAIKCQCSCNIGEALEAKVVQNMYDNIDNESSIAYAYSKTNILTFLVHLPYNFIP